MAVKCAARALMGMCNQEMVSESAFSFCVTSPF